MDPDTYLTSMHKQFAYYKQLGDRTFEQLTAEQCFWQPQADSNSIAVIVKHLWGNMLSRWTNFLTTDGEKGWRNREAEFEPDLESKAEMVNKWEEGWGCLFDALKEVKPENLDYLIYIRNQGHTVTEALNRQLAHYAYHVGQIVLIGKMLKGAEWRSLSIPRGQSQSFNAEKFSQPQQRRHFTDDWLDGSTEA